jgi:hypothetical protein
MAERLFAEHAAAPGNPVPEALLDRGSISRSRKSSHALIEA